MRDVGMPAGLAEVGYGAGDVPDLVDGATKQQRLLATAPLVVTDEDLAAIFTASLEPGTSGPAPGDGAGCAHRVERMDTFGRDGLRFDVRDGGPRDGDGTVVLLHGFPQDGTAFDGVVPPLHAAGLRTLVPDQRGYSPGARPSPRSAYATERDGARRRSRSWTPPACAAPTSSGTTGAGRRRGCSAPGTPTGCAR